MEKALHQYTLEPLEKPFDMKSVPLATAPVFEQKTGTGQGIFEGNSCLAGQVLCCAYSRVREEPQLSSQVLALHAKGSRLGTYRWDWARALSAPDSEEVLPVGEDDTRLAGPVA